MEKLKGMLKAVVAAITPVISTALVSLAESLASEIKVILIALATGVVTYYVPNKPAEDPVPQD